MIVSRQNRNNEHISIDAQQIQRVDNLNIWKPL